MSSPSRRGADEANSPEEADGDTQYESNDHVSRCNRRNERDWWHHRAAVHH